MNWGNPAASQPMPRSAWEIANRAAGNGFLSALPDDAIALLEPDLKQITLPPGAACYNPGGPIDQVYFPQSGMISLVVAADGRNGRNILGRARGRRRPAVRFRSAAFVHARHRANSGDIFRDFRGPFRTSRKPPRGAARYDRPSHRDQMGRSPAERGMQRPPRRRVASMPLAIAMRRSGRQRSTFADARLSGGDARRAANDRDAACPGAAEARHRTIRPGPDHDRRSARVGSLCLRVLPGDQSSRAAERAASRFLADCFHPE